MTSARSSIKCFRIWAASRKTHENCLFEMFTTSDTIKC